MLKLGNYYCPAVDCMSGGYASIDVHCGVLSWRVTVSRQLEWTAGFAERIQIRNEATNTGSRCVGLWKSSGMSGIDALG